MWCPGGSRAMNFTTENKEKPWFSQSCSDLRNTVKNYEKLVNKYPFNGEYREMFYTYKAKYRRLCYLRNKIIETQFVMIFTKIFTIIPKSFLELLNKLDKSFTRQVSSHEVNSEEFYQLFFKPQ